jgi:hypothetical protein
MHESEYACNYMQLCIYIERISECMYVYTCMLASIYVYVHVHMYESVRVWIV